MSRSKVMDSWYMLAVPLTIYTNRRRYIGQSHLNTTEELYKNGVQRQKSCIYYFDNYFQVARNKVIRGRCLVKNESLN